MNVVKGNTYCIKHDTSSRKMLVIATGKNKKVSSKNKSETDVFYESFLISYVFTNTDVDSNILLSSGEVMYFKKSDILYQCGSIKKLEQISKRIDEMLDKCITDQYYEIGSMVYHLNYFKQIVSLKVLKYKYNTATELVDIYLANPLDDNDYIILCESFWKDQKRINKSIEKLVSLWKDTK